MLPASGSSSWFSAAAMVSYKENQFLKKKKCKDLIFNTCLLGKEI
jgi:hypothetical protein